MHVKNTIKRQFSLKWVLKCFYQNNLLISISRKWKENKILFNNNPKKVLDNVCVSSTALELFILRQREDDFTHQLSSNVAFVPQF